MLRKVKVLKVLVAHSCPSLCNPTDYSLPGSSVHGIVQARILELVAISFSIRKAKSESHSVMSDSLRPYGLYSPWNSPGHGVGSLSLLQGIFLTQGVNLRSPALQADS